MKFKLTNSQDVVLIEKADGSIIDLTNLRGGVVEGYYVDGNFYDMIIEHDYVEIGGIKWATANLGANSITDAGLYYQWGDILGYTTDLVGNDSDKKPFSWGDYKYWEAGTGFTKYNSTDGKTVLEASDDAAVATWGNGWRMPTISEYATLGNAVNATIVENYNDSGIGGLLCVDKTDSSKILFFPYTGGCSDGVFNDSSKCIYWASSNVNGEVNSGSDMFATSGDIDWQSYGIRALGLPIRAIYNGPVPTPITPESETIYIDKSTNLIFIYNNEINRWVKLGNSNAALLGDPDGTAFSADFDPQTDTVWNKAQVLTSAQKAQVKENLGLLDIVYNTTYDPINNKVATMADIPSIPSNATQSTAGLMSAADKTKLDDTKNITVSSSDPTSSDGEDGDIWFVYDAS